jgi:hypothetical protein
MLTSRRQHGQRNSSKGKIHTEIAKKGLMVRQVLKIKEPRRISTAL